MKERYLIRTLTAVAALLWAVPAFSDNGPVRYASTLQGTESQVGLSHGDSFRSHMPLNTFFFPRYQAHYVQSMLDSYDQCGWFPAWSAPGETGVMFGRQVFNYRYQFDKSDGFMKGRLADGTFDQTVTAHRWGSIATATSRFSICHTCIAMLASLGKPSIGHEKSAGGSTTAVRFSRN